MVFLERYVRNDMLGSVVRNGGKKSPEKTGGRKGKKGKGASSISRILSVLRQYREAVR